MKPTSVASLILYMTYWLASSEWDRKDAETCQLKIQDPFVFRVGSEGPQRSFVLCLSLFSPPSSCSPEIAHKSFIHSVSQLLIVTKWYISLKYVCILLWAELCLLKFCIEALTPNVTVFGMRTYKEVIKVKCSQKGGALTSRSGTLKRKGRDARELSASVPTQGRGHVSTEQEGSCLEARKKTLPRNQHWRHLDLGLLASRTVRK